jgi:hypothetical protein
MAIKIGGDTVISDTKVLENISDCDVTTDAAINNAIKNQNNILRIIDSNGVEVRTLYCAATTPV